jgi:predicted nucleic acid-binding protein
VFVDTSVWSLAFRRNAPAQTDEVGELLRSLAAGDATVTTGLILQELLRGFSGPRARQQIIDRFSALPLLVPDRRDYIDAAALRNDCRRAGIQIGTIDALFAQLCIRHDLTMLTADKDFSNIATRTGLKIWSSQRKTR